MSVFFLFMSKLPFVSSELNNNIKVEQLFYME